MTVPIQDTNSHAFLQEGKRETL